VHNDQGNRVEIKEAVVDKDYTSAGKEQPSRRDGYVCRTRTCVKLVGSLVRRTFPYLSRGLDSRWIAERHLSGSLVASASGARVMEMSSSDTSFISTQRSLLRRICSAMTAIREIRLYEVPAQRLVHPPPREEIAGLTNLLGESQLASYASACAHHAPF
jgi:hypothetical protein